MIETYLEAKCPWSISHNTGFFSIVLCISESTITKFFCPMVTEGGGCTAHETEWGKSPCLYANYRWFDVDAFLIELEKDYHARHDE